MLPARLLRSIGCTRQTFQDAAVLRLPCLAASGTKLLQLFLQGAQFLDALADVPDVLVQHGVHVPAVLVGRILEAPEDPDLIKQHVQAAAVPDELQPGQVVTAVGAVVRLRTRRLRQQDLPLVIANRLDGGLGCGSKFTNLDGHLETSF